MILEAQNLNSTASAFVWVDHNKGEQVGGGGDDKARHEARVTGGAFCDC